MRFIGRDEIRRILTFPLLVAALEAAHRRPKIEVQAASSAARAGSISFAMRWTRAATWRAS